MKTVIKTQLMIGGLEVVGDTHLVPQCHGVLSLNWEGNVERVLFNVPSDKGWYECIDKGGIPLYGFNKSGNVICCMVLLAKGEQDHKGNKYNTDVIFVAPAERTDTWGWDVLQN
jgi:hypothetical protein